MTVQTSTSVSRHADLFAGLRRPPRSISSKYFYDDRGSALFDAICDAPEYYLTDAEQELLERVAPRIAEITRATELIELGSGTARKTRTLIAALLGVRPELHYAPLDISPFALEQAAAVAREFSGVRVTEVVCDYTRSLDALEPDPGCLAAFLGSTIGNFTHERGVELLRRLRRRLAPGDWFLLGVDLVKPVEVLEAAYNDEEGITAEFNRNILRVVNREIGADFDPEAFDHLAFFDPNASRIEMHLVSRRDQSVRLADLDLEIDIARGERIHTEISRKFTRASAERLLTESGFAPRRWFTSANDYFALALGSAAGD